jgi:flagellar basal body rod protein FlgF
MMSTQLAAQQRGQLQTAEMLANASATGFQNALRAEAADNKKKQQNAELRGNR